MPTPLPHIFPEAVRQGAVSTALEAAGAVKVILATALYTFDPTLTTTVGLANECAGGTYARTSLDIISVARVGNNVQVTANPCSVGRPGAGTPPAWVILERASDHAPLCDFPFDDDLADPVTISFPSSVVIDQKLEAGPVAKVAGVNPDGTGNVPASDLADALPVGDWHIVGDPGEPAFLNSWADFGGMLGLAPTRVRKNLGNLELEVVVHGGAPGDPIFTLPIGYRPDAGRPLTGGQAGKSDFSAFGFAFGSVGTSGDVTPSMAVVIDTAAAGGTNPSSNPADPIVLAHEIIPLNP